MKNDIGTEIQTRHHAMLCWIHRAGSSRHGIGQHPTLSLIFYDFVPTFPKVFLWFARGCSHLCQDSCSSPLPMLSTPLRKVTNSRSYWKEKVFFKVKEYYERMTHDQCVYKCVGRNALQMALLHNSCTFSKRIDGFHVKSKLFLGKNRIFFMKPPLHVRCQLMPNMCIESI